MENDWSLPPPFFLIKKKVNYINVLRFLIPLVSYEYLYWFIWIYLCQVEIEKRFYIEKYLKFQIFITKTSFIFTLL